MGAIVVSVFVTVVAIIGVVYFNYQDKKEAGKAKNKQPSMNDEGREQAL